mmetsp:Transcript_7356/g.16285  ORF Transcript_7356/g.16285 Transcript_7356/m.16285 type:complete len:307 (+) Transcript_7356:122-1042(+)
MEAVFGKSIVISRKQTLALLADLEDHIERCTQLEGATTAALSSSGEARVQAYTAVLRQAFVRVTSAVHLMCFVDLFGHAQVVLLQRLVANQQLGGGALTTEAERHFLNVLPGLCRLSENGLVSLVEVAVGHALAGKSLKTPMGKTSLSEIIRAVRRDMDSRGGLPVFMQTMLRTLSTCSVDEGDPQLQFLNGYMAEVMESEAFQDALAAALDHAFAIVLADVDHAGPGRTSHGSDAPTAARVAWDEGRLPLAKVGPMMANTVPRILAKSEEQPFLPPVADNAPAQELLRYLFFSTDTLQLPGFSQA